MTTHEKLSHIKSGLRIVACVTATALGSVVVLAFGLFVAELVGVTEEVFGA
ncbi:MAG: hypothetical protein L0Z53_06720 [Acidobacteriales bacterium]|nr:hypothetical protein [Terriglobales bacterium]